MRIVLFRGKFQNFWFLNWIQNQLFLVLGIMTEFNTSQQWKKCYCYIQSKRWLHSVSMNLMTLFEEWCWNPASVYQCWIESQRQNFGWTGREGLSIALPSKGGHSKLAPIRLSHPGMGREGSYSVKATGHDQLLGILLNGWWWGNWESASSAFWFQSVWGRHACGQHTITFFPLVEVSVPAKQFKRLSWEYYR